MHFLAISLRKDWARVRRDPSSLLTAMGIPVVLAVLMSLVFGRDPVVPRGRLLVADEDHSIARRDFWMAFAAPLSARWWRWKRSIATRAGRASNTATLPPF
jgi:hypothetical protein